MPRSDLLPEALQAMLKHAAETHAADDIAKAESEYILAVNYSSKVYHSSSAITGLVLLKLVVFCEATGQKSKSAIAAGRTNAILAGYNA